MCVQAKYIGVTMVRWRRGGAAVVEGGATRGGVTGGVTHDMPNGGGEMQQ